MTDFVVTITDPAHLAGITWAREQAVEPLATDADYVQWVMAEAAASYAEQQYMAEARAAAEAGRAA